VFEISFGEEENVGVVLRGVNESMCLNLGVATISGGTLNISVEWKESI
jgi:hypothetical protein